MVFKMVPAVLLSCCLLMLPASSAADQHVTDLADAINKFGLELYGKLTASNTGNVVFSPLGVSTSLAMPIMGMKSTEADELRHLLHLDEVSVEKVYPSIRTLLESLTPPEQDEAGLENEQTPQDLHMGSTLFLEKRYKISPQFIIDSRLFYHGQAERMRLDTEEAPEHINKWARTTSGQKIQDIVKAKILDDKTKSLLTNVVSFSGNWTMAFQLQAQQINFYRTLKDTVKTKLMFQQWKFRAGIMRELDTHVLEIPYAGNKLRMVVLLPIYRAGLTELEQKLTDVHLKELHGVTEEKLVDVFLPPFQIETSLPRVEEVLKSLGVDKVPLPLDGTSDVDISRVLHKARVEVGAQGVAPLKKSTKGLQQTRIIATHPFMFFVQDVETGVLVLMGCVKDPTALPPAKPPTTVRKQKDEL